MYIYKSKQEVFDKVCAWLLRDNGKRAYDADNRVCMYLTPDGNMCAVGVLMQECNHFLRSLRGDVCELYEVASEEGLELPFSEELNIFNSHILARLQEIHDDECNTYWKPEGGHTCEMVEALKKVATDYNLTFTSPNQ